MAETCQNKGRYFEALSFYRDIVLNAGDAAMPATLYKNMGDIYYEFLESYDQALSCYRSQLAKYPQDSHAPEIGHRIARILYMRGERDQSLAHYKALLSSYPDYCKKKSIPEEMEAVKKGTAVFGGNALVARQVFPRQIRVLLRDDAAAATLSAKDGLEFSIAAPGSFMKSAAGEVISCSVEKAGLYINNYGPVKEPVLIKAKGKECIEIDKKAYRGMLQIFLQDGKLMLVNHVPLEEYLYGVLAKEVPASWPAAALEAQAVAARTYALYHAVKNAPALFDVFSTTASQAYGGRDSEKSAARNAVDATRQRVLSYAGKLALTLYHANSGAMTEAPQDIWGWSAPYLQSRPDAFSRDMKNFTWDCSPAAEELAGRLQQAGFPQPALETITPLQRDSSGRITRISLQGGNRTAYLSGNSFRLLAGTGKIKSAQFTVERNKQSFIFNGSGYGHGVGMSQWGACSMARQGYQAEQILQWYYPGTAVVRVSYKNK